MFTLTCYQPSITYAARDWAGAAGFEFDGPTLGRFDVAVSYGQNETDRTTYDTINPSYGPASPTSFYLGSWKSRTTSGTIDYVRDLPIAFVDTAYFRRVRCIGTSTGARAILAMRSVTRAARSEGARSHRCTARAASTIHTPRCSQG